MKNYRPWRPDEDRFLMDNHLKITVAEIARILGVSKGRVEYRLEKLRGGGYCKGPSRADPAQRRCLGCSEMFASSHAGNRLCPRCRDNPRPMV